MGKFIANVFLGALAIGLSIFTASRTLDLLTWALPAGQTIYTWLGLAAFEGGMYFWSFYFVMGAKGTPQRSISVIMAVFSIIAVMVATIADLSLDAGQAGKVAPLSRDMQQAMIVFLGVVISLNVASFLACKLMSVENMRAIREGVAEDHIYTEGLRAIDGLAPQMAAEAAPYLAAEWGNRTWQRIVPGVKRSTQYLGPVSVAEVAAPSSQPQVLAQATPAPQLPAPQKKRGFWSGLFGGPEKQGAPSAPEPVAAPGPHDKLTPLDAIQTARLAGRQARRARQQERRLHRRRLQPGASGETRAAPDM